MAAIMALSLKMNSLLGKILLALLASTLLALLLVSAIQRSSFKRGFSDFLQLPNGRRYARTLVRATMTRSHRKIYGVCGAACSCWMLNGPGWRERRSPVLTAKTCRPSM
jgi:hypothetical protein